MLILTNNVLNPSPSVEDGITALTVAVTPVEVPVPVNVAPTNPEGVVIEENESIFKKVNG